MIENASRHPLLLAIESAWRGCSVAVVNGERVVAYRRDDEPHKQSARLVPMIEAAMREAGVEFAQLSRIVATNGPGSFTGIRIGLATARALGFAAGVEVFGISTLAAMAAAQRDKGKKILALLEAGRGEFYAQTFEAEPFRAVNEAAIVSAAEAEALAAGCDHMAREAPDARAVAWLATQDEFLQPPDPVYIRPCAAKPNVLYGTLI